MRPEIRKRLVAAAVEAETGRRPALSTTGGTSDARFIKRYCPVVEYGVVGSTMHKVDEYADVADIVALERITYRLLQSYFAVQHEMRLLGPRTAAHPPSLCDYQYGSIVNRSNYISFINVKFVQCINLPSCS